MLKEKVYELVSVVVNFLDYNYANGDCKIYFNDTRYVHVLEDYPTIVWDNHKRDYIERASRTPWILSKDVYFEIADTAVVVCLDFYGSFYDIINAHFENQFIRQEEFRQLLEKFGYYYELYNNWHLLIKELH